MFFTLKHAALAKQVQILFGARGSVPLADFRNLKALFTEAGEARINIFTQGLSVQRQWLELLLTLKDQQIANLLQGYVGSLLESPAYIDPLYATHFREMVVDGEAEPQPISVLSDCLQKRGWADLRLGPLLVSGGAQPVDITGFAVTPTGFRPEQLVETLRSKFGEVRNVKDANGNIIPNRLVAVATEAGLGSWNKKMGVNGSNFTTCIYGVITSINLFYQAERLQELYIREAKLKGVLGFCDAQSAALAGRSLKKEFYDDRDYITWFFTGQLWDKRNDASIKSPINLKATDIPSNDTRFASWLLVNGLLDWVQADRGNYLGGLVLEAQW
jgi:hypothetical protein